MPKFSVDVKAFIAVSLEAPNAAEARKRAEHFVGWLDPTMEFILDYNADHEDEEIEGASIGIDGESDVELDDDDEICGQCNDPRCDGCVPFDTPSLDTSFHDHEMGG